MRILIDTNVFVAAAYNHGSASRKIVHAVQQRQLALIVSPAIVWEYRAVLPKAVRREAERVRLLQTIESAEVVSPSEVPAVTEDRSDDKFLAAAVAAGADSLVTNDAHLLAVHPHAGIEILRPGVFWNRWCEGSPAGDSQCFTRPQRRT